MKRALPAFGQGKIKTFFLFKVLYNKQSKWDFLLFGYTAKRLFTILRNEGVINMTEIIVGEKVLNKLKEAGTIVSFDGKIIVVQYGNRVAKLLPDAFEKGFLKDAKLT